MKTVDLSGIWQFQLDEEKTGAQKGLEKGGYDDIISLPGTTSMAKKGRPNPAREEGFLTDAYAFEGYAWFSREITLEEECLGQPVHLYLERTRMTRVWVDGNEVTGEYVSGADSLCTPHIYDLTAFLQKETFTLTILVSNTDYPTKGGHMTSPDTQSNWNGITGRMELQIFEEECLEDIRVDANLQEKTAELTMTWRNYADIAGSLKLHFTVYQMQLKGAEKNDRPCHGPGGDYQLDALPYAPQADGAALPAQTCDIVLMPGENVHRFSYRMGDNFIPWSEYSPVIYRIVITGGDGACYGSTTFGMRELSVDEHSFYINGQKTFLRGKHDGMIFPLTGAAPCTLQEWLHVMGIAKEYGINHYRYHTSCPPEAAFEAADLLGIYMEPELPFWGTVTAPTDENHNGAEQAYLVSEGFRMMRAFGNHASYAMMSLGNELWGSSERLGEILRGYRSVDRRHLYTQGSNNFQFIPCILPEDDFFVGVRFAVGQLIRGSYAMCDAPQGFVQTQKPNTVYDYDAQFLPYLAAAQVNAAIAPGEEIEIQYGTGTKKVKAVDAGSFSPVKPVVSHEIGQYCTFPNFREIEKYTGVLEARNLQVFRERLEEAGMLDLAEDYFEASGKLAVECYKLELEAAHRSRYLAGYQILDIQDFCGQGTALVGILDAFMDNKGLVTPAGWRSFCSDTVILAAIKDFVLEGGTRFTAPLLMSNYNPALTGTDASPRSCSMTWKMYEIGRRTIDFDEVSEVLVASGKAQAQVRGAGVTEFGQIQMEVPDRMMPAQWKLVLELDGLDITNSYSFWVFPSRASYELPAEKNCRITADVEEALTLLEQGEKVVLFSDTHKEYIRGFYCTEFWNYPMFRGISEWMKKELPVGTMGLLIQKDHPALSLFATLQYETPQWYEIVTDAHLHILDNAPKQLRPIVQMMDNFERNHRLGLLWEVQVGGGRLLVCAAKLEKLVESAEGRQFARSILSYAESEAFQPEVCLSPGKLRELI